MSDTPQGAATPPVNGAPVMRVLNQYLKDLSFENPGAPQTLTNDAPDPGFEVAVDVNARRIKDDEYEVELSCSVTARRDNEPVYVAECNYAGHFLIQNLTPDQLQPALLVEGPRILFPFARQVLASATRDGGFVPFLMEPIDFGRMYQMQMARQQAAAQEAGSQEGGPPPVGSA